MASLLVIHIKYNFDLIVEILNLLEVQRFLKIDGLL